MDVVAISAVGGGAVAVLAFGDRLIGRPLRRLLRQNELFREEWWGRPAEPALNRPRTPSVPERLISIEMRQARIEGELQPNSGATTRDALDRIEREQRRQGDLLRAHVNDPHAHRGGE